MKRLSLILLSALVFTTSAWGLGAEARLDASQPSGITKHLKSHTLYFNAQNGLEKITVKLAQHQLPTFFQRGDKKPEAIQCTYKNVDRITRQLITTVVSPNIKNSTLQIASRFYHQVSPQINYVIACQGKFPAKIARSQVSDTHDWYQGPYSKHVGAYAQGRALSYMTPKRLIVIIGHRPCLCATRSETLCQNFMAKMRKDSKNTLTLNKLLIRFSRTDYSTEKSNKLIQAYLISDAQNRKIDPCDRATEKGLQQLAQVRASMDHDLNAYKKTLLSKKKSWWWPF